MAKFLVETSLTVTLRRVFEVEADNVDEAEEMFAEGQVEDGPISEETVKVVGDEYVVSVKSADVKEDPINEAWSKPE